jgi:hypothetical protein
LAAAAAVVVTGAPVPAARENMVAKVLGTERFFLMASAIGWSPAGSDGGDGGGISKVAWCCYSKGFRRIFLNEWTILLY